MKLKNVLRAVGIITQPSGTVSHDTARTNERYNFFLRQNFHEIRNKTTTPDVKNALWTGTKLASDTAGPAGLGTTLFNFLEMPSIPLRPINLKKLVARIAERSVAQV